MTVKELIKVLNLLENEDAVVILEGFDGGWSNIDLIRERGSCVAIVPEENPVFSEN